MQDKFDAVIIGGGIGGLFTGLYMQKLGKRSLILEHSGQAGGNMSGLWRKGFYFDCGDQSFANMGIVFPLLEDLGLYDPDEWDSIRWRFVTKDLDVPLHDLDQIREDFKKFFPSSSPELDKWFDYITPPTHALKGMMDGAPFFVAVDGFKKWRPNRAVFKYMRTMAKAGFRRSLSETGSELSQEIFKNDPRLAFLFGDWGYPNMLLMLHFAFWYTFVYDYYYPKAGIQGMLNKLVEAYQERGGEIRFNTTVEKLCTDGKKITSVETSADECYRADYFVNTGNPKRLINEMLDEPGLWGYKDRQIVTNANVSTSVTSAFLGVDMPAEEIKKCVKEHHTLYWRTYELNEDINDPDLHRKGFSQINATSLHNPELAPDGQSALVIQVWSPYQWMNNWATGSDDPCARGEKYKNLKDEVLDAIIEESEFIIPGLKDRIVYKELATPKTLARYTLNPEGACYGWTYDFYQSHMAGKFARFRTPVKNLFMAGQYSMWPAGVIFSALSGRIVSKGIYDGGFWRQLLY